MRTQIIDNIYKQIYKNICFSIIVHCIFAPEIKTSTTKILNLESRKEIAVQKKLSGAYNCTQSVCCTYYDLTSIDETTIKHVGNCFGAGMGNMEAGNTYEMYAVAAGVIGGISPMGGTGLLLGTFAGAAVWQTLENGLNMVGAQVGLQRIVIGVIVVSSVLLDVLVRNGGLSRKHMQK